MAWGQTIFDGTKVLRGGGEWYEEVYIPWAGTANVTAAGTAGFYIGVYPRGQFDEIKKANPLRFPFLLGGARLSHFVRFTVTPGSYVLVVRVTSWAPNGGEVRVQVQLGP